MADGASERMFADASHVFIFVVYIALFVNQGVLVTASKNADGSFPYNKTTVVLLTELLKLVLSVGLFWRAQPVGALLADLVAHARLLLYYLVPAFLYCLYNNLAFVNLGHFDPATYFLLLNFRTVLTGIIFQMVFKKRLTRRQWVALVLLTLGCAVKQVRFDELRGLSVALDWHLALIACQVCCSCFAGVYNEYLLKDVGPTVNIWTQNVCMYVDSILMNLGFLYFDGSLPTAFTGASLRALARVLVLAIAANNALAGVTTSLFLKKFNSVLKTFTTAIDLMLSALAGWLFFGVPIDSFCLIALALVSYATYLYSTQPVVNKPKLPAAAAAADEKQMLQAL